MKSLKPTCFLFWALQCVSSAEMSKTLNDKLRQSMRERWYFNRIKIDTIAAFLCVVCVDSALVFITPFTVFLLFFLDGTMDLVGTVQLQKTL